MSNHPYNVLILCTRSPPRTSGLHERWNDIDRGAGAPPSLPALPPEARPLSAVASRSGAAAQPNRFSTIQRMIDAEFAKDSRGGVSVGVVENGELVWTYCVGQMDEAKRRPATVDTIYIIGSTTKILTGLMLLQLVERGPGDLSDPVERYVPEIRQMKNEFPWAPPITLMQLATMTAGTQRGASIPPGVDKAAVDTAKSFEDMVALAIPGFEYSYEPGTASRYSNAGYSVLGLALSRAAKRARLPGLCPSMAQIHDPPIPRFPLAIRKAVDLTS